MKIKKIDIVGFKSFLDRATINFPPGISAIVGPNGCGKSNIIDALRWVMGEQSIKQLRGKDKEDIIFAGANGKAPLNMAEVTLTLANDNGHAPEEFRDFSEISVTRRLFRSGESAYLINRQPCRLKDIYNLFMGSGVGTRTFSIIQQGNIGAIIDAGPDERRLFIEEAAGVTRYKFRKNEALRKVNATQQNLLRIHDIIAEVNRQMAGLHRQAKKAERFKHYQQRIQILDTHLLLNYYENFSHQMAQAQSILKELKDREIAHVTDMKKVDAAIEAIKLKRQEKDREIALQKTNRHDIQRKVDRAEAELSHLKNEVQRLGSETTQLEHAREDLASKTANIGSEVSEAEAQNQKLEKDINDLQSQIDAERGSTQAFQNKINDLNREVEEGKNQLMRLVAEEARYKNIYQTASNNKEALKRRLTRINEEVVLAKKKVETCEAQEKTAQAELDEIQQYIGELEAQINTQKTTLSAQATELGAQVKRTQSLELERNQNRSQLANLKKMAANFDWYRDGVKSIMQASKPLNTGEVQNQATLSGVIGPLADIIEPTPGFETAVEAVLGESLQYILVENQGAGAAAIEYLQNSGNGRSGFIPMGTVKPVLGHHSDQVPNDYCLLRHVKTKPEFQDITQALLGHVAVVQNMLEALSLFNRNGRVQTIVTRSGDVVSHQGLLIGGSQEKLTGILSKKQELKATEDLCEQLEQKLQEARKHQQALEKSVRELETDLQQNISRKNNAAEEAIDIEKSLYRLGEELKSARRNYEVIELQQDQLIGEESDLDDEMAKYNSALEKITREVEQAQSHSTAATQQITEISSLLEKQNQKIVDLKLQLTAFKTKFENGVQTLRRLREFERDSTVRLEQLKKDIAQKTEKRSVSESQAIIKEQSLNQLYANLMGLDEKLSIDETEYKTIDADLKESDHQMSTIQSAREKTIEKIRLVELDLSEKRIRRDNINAKIQERYHISIADLRMKVAQREEKLEMSVAEMEKEIAHFRSKTASIGDVNLGAIKEYEVLKERFDFLSAQRVDLEKAIDDLHKVIRKINRITQERFSATFSLVNEKLQRVFPRLFEGGSARLELTDPGKPLETGVEYLVSPPGKKLTRMSLLSGGEKALSAIAFIFAIFLIRPTSFCLLDEIDAPLDEANVVRFNNLMRVIGEKSQIIMITHNKKSMEFAEMLFGITMEQKGISKVVSVNLKETQAQ